VSRADFTPSVLWSNWQTETHLILRLKLRNHRGDFVFWCLNRETLHHLGFEAKSGETVTTSFEAKLKKTVTTGFEAKPSETVATGFEAKPPETIAASFEAKPPETVATHFEAKPVKTVWVVLRPNHSQTVAISFEAQIDEKPSEWFLGQITHKPSTLVLRFNRETRAPRLHVHGADLTWCHLTPAHHETSKHDSLNEAKLKENQNETVPDSNSNLTKSMTHHNQTKELITWFLKGSLFPLIRVLFSAIAVSSTVILISSFCSVDLPIVPSSW
jgi:hypothetical protein